MRRARGFTLLELGVVLGVMSILLAAIVATTSGLYRNARTRRAGMELGSIARAAANAQKRNLKVEAGPVYRFRFNGANATAQLSTTVPVCYDLSRFPNSDGVCPANGQAGGAWSGADYPPPNPVAAGSPLLDLLGGNKIYAGGYNPWCLPYVVCLFTYRAEVLTCVPVQDLNGAGMESSFGCGNCTGLAPVTNEPTRCVKASAPTFGQSNQLNFSYSRASFLDPLPLVYDHDPRP